MPIRYCFTNTQIDYLEYSLIVKILLLILEQKKQVSIAQINIQGVYKV